MKRTPITAKNYIAGFIDGEGCISITRAKKQRSKNYTYVLNIIITQRNPSVLQWIQAYYGGRIHQLKKLRATYGYQLRLGQAESFHLLQDLENRSILKHQQVKLGLDFQKLKENKTENTIEFQQACKDQMHKLNKD